MWAPPLQGRGVNKCLLHAESVLRGNAAKRCRAACVDTREVARVIMRVKTALIVAAYIEALDDRAIFAKRLAVCIRDNAVDSHQKLAANTRRIKRGLRNIA